MAKSAAPAAAPAPQVAGRGGGKADGPMPAVTEAWADDAAMPVPSGPVEVVEMDGGHAEQNKAEQIMQALRGDGTTEEFKGTPATDVVEVPADPDAPAEAAAEEPAKPATRKDLLKAIDGEKRARALEAQLRDAQAQLAKLTKGSITEMMAARGMTREQAMEAIVLAETPGAKPVDPDPERTQLRATVAELQAARAADIDRQVRAVVAEKLADVEVPLVKATKRVAIPQDDGTAKYKFTHDVLAELAEQLWIDEGRPAADFNARQAYLVPAAQKLEEMLAEEHAGLLAAVRPKAAEKPKAAPVVAVGKRGAPARVTETKGEFDAMDDYSRRLAIKQRYGV